MKLIDLERFLADGLRVIVGNKGYFGSKEAILNCFGDYEIDTNETSPKAIVLKESDEKAVLQRTVTHQAMFEHDKGGTPGVLQAIHNAWQKDTRYNKLDVSLESVSYDKLNVKLTFYKED